MKHSDFDIDTLEQELREFDSGIVVFRQRSEKQDRDPEEGHKDFQIFNTNEFCRSAQMLPVFSSDRLIEISAESTGLKLGSLIPRTPTLVAPINGTLLFEIQSSNRADHEQDEPLQFRLHASSRVSLFFPATVTALIKSDTPESRLFLKTQD